MEILSRHIKHSKIQQWVNSAFGIQTESSSEIIKTVCLFVLTTVPVTLTVAAYAPGALRAQPQLEILLLLLSHHSAKFGHCNVCCWHSDKDCRKIWREMHSCMQTVMFDFVLFCPLEFSTHRKSIKYQLSHTILLH